MKPVDVVKEDLGCSPKTAYNKVTGATPFTLMETVIIRNKRFPDMTLDELFLPIQDQEGA
ncbi:MAG: hypothetical protein ACYDEJ_03495 [Desulfitobacteriaceae bacterium]